MRLRKALFVCTLVLVMPLIGLAQSTAPEVDKVQSSVDEKMTVADEKAASVKSEAALVPAPLELARKDEAYKSAYHDVYHILSTPNPCSSFFGGSETAVEVLNTLFGQLQTSRLSTTRTGLSMFGTTRSISNARTGASYRMFEKAVINTTGPFYQRKFAPSDPFVPNVGSFQPNTREARAAIVLHELGHLLQGANGSWLLPNDGESDEQSRKNTSKIEERCGEQLKNLRRTKTGAKQKTP